MSFVPTAQAVLNHWVRILAALEKKINRQSFETWLKPTRYSRTVGTTLFVRIPSAEFEHIGDKYGDLIEEAIENLGLEIETVTFETPQQDPAAPRLREDGGFAPLPSHSANAPRNGSSASNTGPLRGNQATPPPAVEQARFDWNSAAQLNPRYQFDTFVIGSGNQFATAAAKAVAERPSKAYNPLFLYGGAGMGKTHLLNAIGADIKRRQPHALVSYVSGEKFTNEMINSLRYDKMTSFRDRFRNVDVLLIDDIQFLSGKERTQEEFFYTFNTLHEQDKQIVIASDRPPKELPDFEDRLRSRFEWGLIADIQPPDLETKVAILQRKAEIEQSQVPLDVAMFIASNVRTNVRELEGALIRVIAWCSHHGVECSLAVAQQCLKQFIDSQVRKITIEAIQRAVAEQFGMRVPELKQKNNSRQIVVPRQIAMYLAKQMTEASLPEIGRQFGGKHHTTVMHSIAKIDEQRRSDKDLNRTINKLMETLN
ncbi:chromosomal replication initiator protein DnaA [Granulicella sp. WH15]|uniref:chromosomal replication initiator protein DnaA n=1 Tax=Granulicella sp. WH15 TaxID=2602070 RepID=UPI001366F7D7|nr:chromosomal replication initiator protein DnaA [Granulicella sp. WH15]QHN01938.1 chromosomal replication initiator protein DnaA [Granulicella sp. WH15]